MGILNDNEVTMLQGDIEALKIELNEKIDDLSVWTHNQIDQKLDYQEFLALKDECNRIFGNLQHMIDDHFIRLEVLENEVEKIQQQNESILRILTIYNKSIKIE